jgi:hypothetical protein
MNYEVIKSESKKIVDCILNYFKSRNINIKYDEDFVEESICEYFTLSREFNDSTLYNLVYRHMLSYIFENYMMNDKVQCKDCIYNIGIDTGVSDSEIVVYVYNEKPRTCRRRRNFYL